MGILGRFCGMLPSSRTSMYAPVSAPLKSYNMPHYLRFMFEWASQADFAGCCYPHVLLCTLWCQPLKSYDMPHYLRFMSKWASQADFEPVNSSKRGIFPLLLVF